MIWKAFVFVFIVIRACSSSWISKTFAERLFLERGVRQLHPHVRLVSCRAMDITEKTKRRVNEHQEFLEMQLKRFNCRYSEFPIFGFHGTKKHNIKHIEEDGFDTSACQRSWNGKGCYFSPFSSISLSYGHTKESLTNRRRAMFLCQIIAANPKTWTYSEHANLPPRFLADADLEQHCHYDSTARLIEPSESLTSDQYKQALKISPFIEICVFNSCQAIPLYLIEYEDDIN